MRFQYMLSCYQTLKGQASPHLSQNMLLALIHFASENTLKPSGSNKDEMDRTGFHNPVIVKVVFPGIGAPIEA